LNFNFNSHDLSGKKEPQKEKKRFLPDDRKGDYTVWAGMIVRRKEDPMSQTGINFGRKRDMHTNWRDEYLHKGLQKFKVDA